MAELFKKTQRKAHVSKFQDHEAASTEKLRNKARVKKRKKSEHTLSSDTEDDDLVKFVKAEKIKKRLAQMETLEVNLSAEEEEASEKLQSPHVVASGVVTNSDFTLPLSQENFESNQQNSLKLKLKLDDSNSFYNLRASTKLDQLNEDALLYKQVRRGYLQHQVLYTNQKKKDGRPKESRKEPTLREASHVMKQLINQRLNSINGIVKKEKPRKGQPKPETLKVDDLMLEKIRERWSTWTGSMAAPKIIVKIHEKMMGIKTTKECSEIENPPPRCYVRPCGRDMDWDEFLSCPENLERVPPVTYFHNTPFVDIWADLAVPNMYIELRNPFVKKFDVFWIGRIVHFAGYKGLVQFETFEEDSKKGETGKNYLVWISFCSKVPKPLGWCSKNEKELRPGPVVSKKVHLAAKLADFYSKSHHTIADDHESILRKEFDVVENTWKTTGKYEALDLVSLHQNRLARISAIVGNRINVEYNEDEDPEDDDDYEDGFWFHWKTGSLRKFMWSHTVGVQLNGINPSYHGHALPPESFPSWPEDQIKIEVGMRLETRHPYYTNKIVGAKIVEVLKYGYFMVQTLDEDMLKSVYFVYHITSPFVLPVGFGKSHNIPVEFAVNQYLAKVETNETNECLKLDLLPPRKPNKFKVGHKLEAIEVSTSAYIGPATVYKIAGHLLYLHFDGWNTTIEHNFQWMDVEESEIYPAGYCELMGFNWQSRVNLK